MENIYAGNVKQKNVQKLVDDYMHNYKQYIFEGKEAEMEDITAEDVYEEIRNLKETAGGMDQWTPACLKLLTKEACRRLAQMFNAIEKGASWPKEETIARAAFMAKEEGIELDPLSYRVLLMLPASYRRYAKIRLRHMQPWIEKWVMPEIYAGVEGQGAADAAYETAITMELARLLGEPCTGWGS